MKLFKRLLQIFALLILPAIAYAQGGGSTTIRYGAAWPTTSHQWTIFVYTPGNTAYLCTTNPCNGPTGYTPLGSSGAAPGSPGQIILNIAGAFGANSNVFVDGSSFVNALGYVGNGSGAYSLSGAYNLVTDCSPSTGTQSSICFGLLGKIEGSEAGDGPFEFGRFGQITGAWLKLDSNNCLALGAGGTVAPCAQNAGVMAIINPANPTTPTKINIMKNWTSGTAWEALGCGWDVTDSVYICGSDHGSLSGSNYPTFFTAGGFTNPFWGMVTQGNWVAHSKNQNPDIGSVTVAQQPRIIWISGFTVNQGAYAQPVLNNNSTGTEIGLLAKPSASASPITAQISTTADITGLLGPVVGETNGVVTGTIIVDGGTAYVSPVCMVAQPSGNTGVQATCTATQSGGVINAVTITNTVSNSGYQFAMTPAGASIITITDSAGTGALVLPVITALTGSAIIAQDGSTAMGFFDGSVTIKDWVGPSVTAAGKFTDLGISCVNPRPQNVETFGCLQQTASGTGFYSFTVSMGQPIVKQQAFASPLGGSCPTTASIGAFCTSANLTWTQAFPDNNYTVVCMLSNPTGHPNLQTYTKLASGTGITLTIAAETAAAANAGADCIASHN
jgi:hypothetical protein